MIYIGIDPGLSGAIAAINSDGQPLNVWDIPTITVEHAQKKNKDGSPAKKRHIDMQALILIMRTIAGLGDLKSAGIEQVHAMPDQGVASMFSMGQGYGILQMALVACEIPYTEVSPQRWKKIMMDGMGKEKSNAVLRARQLFPSADLARLSDHGRADALLLAEYHRRSAQTLKF